VYMNRAVMYLHAMRLIQKIAWMYEIDTRYSYHGALGWWLD